MDKNSDPLILKALGLLEGRETIAKIFLMERLQIGHNRAENILRRLGDMEYICYREGYQSHFVDRRTPQNCGSVKINTEGALTDESLMPSWSKYAGRKMANVPAHHLLWLYDNNKCDARVRYYIKSNMDVLKFEIKQLANMKKNNNVYNVK